MAIGTTAALVGASVAGSAMQASAAKKGAKAQENAANREIELRERIYDEQSALFRPFYDTGREAFNALAYEYGIGPRPTVGGTAPAIETIKGQATPGRWEWRGGEAGEHWVPGTPAADTYRVGGQTFDTMDAAEQWANANKTGGTEYGGYTKTPGYDFRLQEGMNVLDGANAAQGRYFSGNALKQAIRYNQDYATGHYQDHIRGLGSLASSGQAAAGQQANAGNVYANGVGNALAGIGNAQSAGAIGAGNAWNNGLTNIIGGMQFNSMLNRNQQSMPGTGIW